MIIVNVIIKRPVEDVWNYFTNISNWSKWNAGSIIQAKWEKGGYVKWGMGSPSQINDYEFQNLVTIGGTWLDTSYWFSPCMEGTLFTIDESSPKNASWPDGGVKHTRELEDSLKKFKQNIESSGKIEAVENTVHLPENMSSDDFIITSIIENLKNADLDEHQTSKRTGIAWLFYTVGLLLFLFSAYMLDLMILAIWIFFIIMIIGLIKPKFVLRTQKYARLKIFGLWLLVTLIAVVIASQAEMNALSKMTPTELVQEWEKNNNSLAIDFLKKIPSEDSLYDKAQSLVREFELSKAPKTEEGTATKTEEGTAPKTKEGKAAKAFLRKLEDAEPVTELENSIELYIESIRRSKGDYIVDYACKNQSIWKSSNDRTLLMTMIYFIDPENYENNYQPFTRDEDGKLRVNYDAGDEIGVPVRRIKFEPPSKVMYMYFIGTNDSPLFHTVPLFFTIVLGDNPYVLEKTPRHANKIFEAVKKSGQNKKDKKLN
jgi:hypothetical protein